MKVLFLNREDAFRHPGGDTVQMMMTKKYLKRMGVNVDVVLKPMPRMEKYDIVHLFNITRIDETYHYSKLAVKYNKKIALSTIYWDMSEFQMHMSEKKTLRKILITHERLRTAVDFVRLFMRGEVRSTLIPQILLGEYRLQKKVLDSANILLPNAQGEFALIMKKFGKRYKYHVVPNAAEERFALGDAEIFIEKYNMSDFVLSVGRVEPRKNTLSLIKACVIEKLPLVIIGDMGDDSYSRKCRNIARDGKILFIRGLRHSSPLLLSAYHAAKVHAMVSWYETPGISSLEAGLARCNIVTTDRGTTKEYFRDMAWYCDPSDMKSIRKAITDAYNSPIKIELREYILQNYTWKRAAEETLIGYRKILHEKTNSM